MIKVGITGGIGSGKTTVAKLFSMVGIPVFSADEEAKLVLNTNNIVRSKIISVFGSDVYLPNRTIDRKKFAAIIFNNKSLLNRVNEFVHPVVRNLFNDWSEMQKTPFVLYEAAILFESGHYKDMNFNILVLAEEETRIKRVIQRDGSSEEQVGQRMASQWSDEEKKGLANFIVDNNEKELVIPQVLNILKKIKTNG